MSDEERRLAAVMFTDIVGYSSLTQKNERLALELLEEHRRIVRPIVARHNGREIKTIGDAFLIEFPSALEATECAVDVQRSLRDYNQQSDAARRVHIRIGIHLGDVIQRQNDVLGDAVNIASRIEPLAEADGICISEQVYDQVRNKIGYPTENLGPRQLKNIDYAIDVHRILWVKDEIAKLSLDKKRIAVLPFANMSPDPADEYFADGLTEELIDRLSQVRELEVIARTSVMSYKKKEKKASEIAKELSVGSLVEGSVRKAGSKIRVTAQLINGATEGHLWSSHYDKNLDDIFAVQSEIAEKVAGELKTQLLDSEKQTLEKKPTENIEAYTCFLRGRELYREETEVSLRQAIGLFEKAIQLDPSFARAYVGVAECHQSLANLSEPIDISLPIVKTSLERAINLDPDLAEAHRSLSEMFYNMDHLLSSETEARRALELNPSLPDCYSQLSELAADKGEPEEMVRQIETAYRLDPIRPRFILLLGTAYLYTAREQEALEFWKKTEQLAPAGTYRGMTEYYLIKGDLEKAKEFHAKAEKLEPTRPWLIWVSGVIAAMEGDREKSLLAIKKIEDAKMGPIGFNFIGYVYHALGDLDSYFEYMNKALEAHTLIPSTMTYSPLFAKARADPRYLELLERLRKQESG
ncbi:MAG: adenylate/guanylate cyclase domain-containing protein [Candidatus Bathyarchaeia archaeon]